MVVVVIALSATEAAAEGAEGVDMEEAEVQKWVYVPDDPTPEEQAKAASKVIQDSKKGGWVTVPGGANAKDVAEKKAQMDAKIMTDAEYAKNSAMRKRQMKEEIDTLAQNIED